MKKRISCFLILMILFLVAAWLPGTALAIQSDSGGGASLLVGQINQDDDQPGLIHWAAVPGGDLVANNEKGSSVAPVSFAEKVGNYIWPGLFAALDSKAKPGIGRASPEIGIIQLE